MNFTRRRWQWGILVLLAAIAVLVNLPVLVMLLDSFKSNSEILLGRSFLPQSLDLTNYAYVWNNTKFRLWLRNSVIIAVASTILTVIIGALAGYALSRFRDRFLSAFANSLLILQMFPLILILVPLFLTFKVLGLTNSHLGVILLYTTLNLPFTVWMYKGFFDAIPYELEQAAQIDGCSQFGSFYRIIVPLTGPGMASVAVFAFLMSWNEYLMATIFLRDQKALTLPVGIQTFTDQFSSHWGQIMASATLTSLPIFLLFLFMQRFIVQGITAGSVKG